jgi:hypothetical protein
MTEQIVTDANGREYITTEPLPAKIIDYEAAYYALQKKIGFDRAELWLKRINEAVAEEREACAKACDRMEQEAEGTECCKWPTPADCAAVIRARSDK